MFVDGEGPQLAFLARAEESTEGLPAFVTTRRELRQEVTGALTRSTGPHTLLWVHMPPSWGMVEQGDPACPPGSEPWVTREVGRSPVPGAILAEGKGQSWEGCQWPRPAHRGSPDKPGPWGSAGKGLCSRRPEKAEGQPEA